jgi:uncharacterized membrane protein YeaQ/YmgE (transglycosylase-associated protein family)
MLGEAFVATILAKLLAGTAQGKAMEAGVGAVIVLLVWDAIAR